MKTLRLALHTLLLAAGLATVTVSASAAEPGKSWMNTSLDPDRRAALVVAEMTNEEKQTLVFGYFATDFPYKKFNAPAEARPGSAGYVAGIARLGIPPQWQTDAGIGVATQGGAKKKRERTALPSGLATAATWDPQLAYRAGAMIGSEARSSGFNVMLAGGVNLVREPRNGRNFEYGGEDPLLAGVIVGAQIAGIESNHIISTVKHYAFNDQETERNSVNVLIDYDQARMSDLLAFQFAIEHGHPGSVMCSYNRAWYTYACENEFLLTDVLRHDWGFKGYVMSDWGATHSTAKAALAGLDQQSGNPFDKEPFFGEMLLKAVADGEVPQARLTEMATRIVRTMFAKGVIDHPVEIGSIDLKAHADVSRTGAEQGAVLLKNENGILPLKSGVARIAVIGGHADKGVLSGGGSSQVYPVGGNAVPGLAPTNWPGPVVYYPSAPLAHIKSLAHGAKVTFDSGTDVQAAAKLARANDIVVVFATQWVGESVDTSLTLPDDQDALIDAVASANPNTIVVLETGGAVLMPWLAKVRGVLETWFPGTSGGEAIANVLFGRVNPSGRLPISFPLDEGQFARASLDEKDAQGKPTATYSEGATVGYKWYDAKNQKPLFPFGFGLSYTSFAYSGVQAQLEGERLLVKFRVSNIGKVAGKDVPQVYVSGPEGSGWEAPRRLGGWQKVELQPGASAQVEIRVDPRLLAIFSTPMKGWRVAPGTYGVSVSNSAGEAGVRISVELPERRMTASYTPQDIQ